MSGFIEKHFLNLILIFAILGFIEPELFVWAKTYIPILLGIIMLGMGMTLNFSDLWEVRKHPKWIILGAILQYLVMPVMAIAIGTMLKLPQEILLGLIIVGSCPGGTASNVMVYLARAHLPLSITLTLISTLLAPVLTPFWIYFLANEYIDISFLSLVKTTFWIVVFPLIDGLIIRKLFTKKIEPVINIFPSVSIIAIAIIIGCVIGLNQETLQTFPLLVLVAVVLHNVSGFVSGYTISKLLKFPDNVCKSIAIEVGMQNSGLGVALALAHFTKLVALPAVLFSIWHNIAGVSLVGFFTRKSKKKLSASVER